MTSTPIPIACWRVRVVVARTVLHFVSRTEPVQLEDGTFEFDLMPAYGDTLGWIDWSQVSAISWRYNEGIAR